MQFTHPLLQVWRAGWRRAWLGCLLWFIWASAAQATQVLPATKLQALHATALTHPDAALARLKPLLDTLDAADPQQVPVLTLLGYAQAQLDQSDAVADTATRLDQWAQRVPDAAPAAGLVRAVLAMRLGPLSRGERLAQQALAQAPAWPWLRWQLNLELAKAEGQQSQFKQALQRFQQNQALADSLGDWAGIRHATLHAQSLLYAQERDAAATLLRQLLGRAEAFGDDFHLANALTVQAYLDAMNDDTPSRLAHTTRALAHARRAASPQQLAGSLASMASGLLLQGRQAEALAMSQEALDLSDESRRSVLELTHGYILVKMRRLDEGLVHLRRGLEVARQRGQWTQLADYHLNAIDTLASGGYSKQAVDFLGDWRKLSFDAALMTQQGALLDLQEAQAAEARLRNLDLLQRDNALKQAEVERRQLVQRFLVAGLLIGLAAVAASCWLLRKQRSQVATLQRVNARLLDMGERDALTGLFNRHWLARRLQSAFHWPQAALLLIDIDRFKRVNDEMGHAAGDQVLVEIARRLQATLRPEDHCLRWGGEEFLVLAPGLNSAEAALLSQRILLALSDSPMMARGQTLRITASIGHGQFNRQGADAWLQWALAMEDVDQALYLAKAHGRNRAQPVPWMSQSATTSLLAA